MGKCNKYNDKAWGTPPPPDPDTLKLMSYNVEYKGFQDGRINDYAKQIQKVGAAVVGTQETQDKTGLESRSSPYKLIPGTDFQNPIYYNPTLVDFAGNSGWMKITNDQIAVDNHIDRTITWANFKMKSTGDEFWFFNTHLPHPSGPAHSRNTHARIAKSLLEKRKALGAENSPTVVVCDCNSFASDGNTEGRFRDVLSQNGIPTAYTAKGNPGHAGLDHIFLSTQFNKLKGYDSGTGKSDHTSITVEAKIKKGVEEQISWPATAALEVGTAMEPFHSFLAPAVLILIVLTAFFAWKCNKNDLFSSNYSYEALQEVDEI